ncbi:MAG: ATP-binding protein [Acidobacteriota bacterium]
MEKKPASPLIKALPHILGIGLSVILISVLHYQTVGSRRLLHEVSQRLYYVPIIYASYCYGIAGGLTSALLSVAFFLPHLGQHSHDPNVYVNQQAELIVFFLIGTTTGLMSTAQKREHLRYQRAAEELQSAYRELKETVDQLLLADRLASLGQLSAALVHEVRNPLASIRGAVEALEPEIPSEHPKREFLDAIHHEIDRLNRLVSEFLHFARPRQPELMPVRPNDVVRSVVTLVAKEATRSRVQVSMQLDDRLPEVIMDGEQIKQALLNLVLNGIQAMNDGGRLEIITKQRGNKLIIGVRDHGLGIPGEVRDRIFDPFVTTKEGGTGLGLAIAYRLVKQHKAEIRAADAPGGGSVFEIELPLQQERELQSSEPAVVPFR